MKMVATGALKYVLYYNNTQVGQRETVEIIKREPVHDKEMVWNNEALMTTNHFEKSSVLQTYQHTEIQTSNGAWTVSTTT